MTKTKRLMRNRRADTSVVIDRLGRTTNTRSILMKTTSLKSNLILRKRRSRMTRLRNKLMKITQNNMKSMKSKTKIWLTELSKLSCPNLYMVKMRSFDQY